MADFLGAAERSLDLALYDFDLTQPTAAVVAGAITEAEGRGVAVRLAFNVDHEKPEPLFPKPKGEPTLIDALDVPTKPIPGVPDLMHHKFAVRDGAAVLTGSTNWTDDSFSRCENLVVAVESEAVAAAYTRDFEQLWSSGSVAESGFVDPDPVRVDGRRVRAWFSPGRGEALATRIAHRIAKARRRIRVCSPVVTSGPILGALAECVSDGEVDVAGVVDATQMRGVYHQWELNGNADWKLPLVARIFGEAPFSGKRSTPYGQGDVHDFMHAKVTVADDSVFAGSYNLSHSGERNAENVLEIRDAELADGLAGWIDSLRADYDAAPLPD
ncbi:MAG TPA: phospholipase D-like domain-containing protein [Gaiellaceae bacterium]|nr:phospholipase D-like domain-containing protein [Gaiellaceae bacterium]